MMTRLDFLRTAPALAASGLWAEVEDEPALVPRPRRFRRLAGAPVPRDVRVRALTGDPGVPSPAKEAYRLTVESGRVTITSRSEDGLVMANRTLAQLGMAESIPSCEI